MTGAHYHFDFTDCWPKFSLGERGVVLQASLEARSITETALAAVWSPGRGSDTEIHGTRRRNVSKCAQTRSAQHFS
ncbi:hypothetical protein SKAU_G00120800 [Synaphobranchus kaupii]|uniref:Uncharacterized protein n=1 Tax=Synaphobranchus kaupii TaxID=118154 RepID=A0A9Q1FNR4_SYNKA|nr:hypothetical protein SKAU_G00120800 [Synaphobranchus kaupii]